MCYVQYKIKYTVVMHYCLDIYYIKIEKYLHNIILFCAYRRSREEVTR